MNKHIPDFATDASAEAFLEQDLSDVDFAQFKPMRFELAPKTRVLNMRLPEPLLHAVRERAAALGMPYGRYVRMVLEADIAQHARAHTTHISGRAAKPHL